MDKPSTPDSEFSGVFRPSALQALLNEWGVSAKRGLSQNFLIDGNIIKKIVRLAKVSPGDRVIEIGPGPGALTEELLLQGAQVTAIEMDNTFARALERLQTADRRLEILQGDFLKFPLNDYLKEHPGKKFKVVANLPYHITTPILTLLLPLYDSFESLTIMVQKEFADRMVAQPKTADFSSFTLFLKFYSDVEGSFTVSPNCFYPKPKVHSSVVHCLLHPPLLEVGIECFFKLTRTAFGQRRKMIRSSVKELYPSERVENVLLSLGKPVTARPEELSIEEWIVFFTQLSSCGENTGM